MLRLLRVSLYGYLLRVVDWSGIRCMREFFGPVDAVYVDGYVHEEGDILTLEFTEVTRNNRERQVVLSMDIQNAERLQYLLNERVKPKVRRTNGE